MATCQDLNRQQDRRMVAIRHWQGGESGDGKVTRAGRTERGGEKQREFRRERGEREGDKPMKRKRESFLSIESGETYVKHHDV